MLFIASLVTAHACSAPHRRGASKARLDVHAALAQWQRGTRIPRGGRMHNYSDLLSLCDIVRRRLRVPEASADLNSLHVHVRARAVRPVIVCPKPLPATRT